VENIGNLKESELPKSIQVDLFLYITDQRSLRGEIISTIVRNNSQTNITQLSKLEFSAVIYTGIYSFRKRIAIISITNCIAHYERDVSYAVKTMDYPCPIHSLSIG
jgi:hypothetical protein